MTEQEDQMEQIELVETRIRIFNIRAFCYI